MEVTPNHPIIDCPFRYDVIGFNYQRPDDGEPYIDLTLRRELIVRRLRFLNPQEIELESGFPGCSGLEIKDVSGHQLAGLRVRVSDFEHSCDGMHFWACDVIDLDDCASE